MRRIGFLLVLWFAACAQERYGPDTPTGYNVVLVTMDGVRWQELFAGSDPTLTRTPGPLFPVFWEQVAPRGVVYGDPALGSEMTVATPANASLPGYMSIYAEVDQTCLTNYCDRIQVPTFVDRLHDELLLRPDQLSLHAAWWKLRLVVSSRPDIASVRAWGGDPGLEHDHPEHALLDPAFEFDGFPVLDGFQYLDRHRPRFMHLALLDSDRFGHAGHYEKYVASLGAYDRLLGHLLSRLDGYREYGRKTAVIITTDHGRGMWDQWHDHGPQLPSSAGVWAFVMLPPDAKEFSLVAPDARRFSHHDVRYTIETLMGLATKESAGASTGFVVREGPTP